MEERKSPERKYTPNDVLQIYADMYLIDSKQTREQPDYNREERVQKEIKNLQIVGIEDEGEGMVSIIIKRKSAPEGERPYKFKTERKKLMKDFDQQVESVDNT